MDNLIQLSWLSESSSNHIQIIFNLEKFPNDLSIKNADFDKQVL